MCKPHFLNATFPEVLILGIDTTCDDTSAALVEDGHVIRSNIIASQHMAHERFGGIVPMLAAREHTRNIGIVLAAALEEAGASYTDIDAVAVSNHQGLMLSLVVGLAAAKSVALACGIPLVGVHHLEGHIYSNIMGREDLLPFPFLCLTVAGGHTLLLKINGHSQYALLGHTRDDAAGEAYDKIARRLGLPYPGGPAIERLAQHGDPRAFAFPRPMIDSPSLEFSFSGLKTAVTRAIESFDTTSSPVPVEDLCASFQQAVVDVLVAKTLRAAQRDGLSRIALAGGVAKNAALRSALTSAARKKGFDTYIPEPELCIDNGAMIAGAGYYLMRERGPSGLTIDALANAPLGNQGITYRPDTKYR